MKLPSRCRVAVVSKFRESQPWPTSLSMNGALFSVNGFAKFLMKEYLRDIKVQYLFHQRMEIGSLEGKRCHCTGHQIKLNRYQYVGDGISNNDSIFVDSPELWGHMKAILEGHAWCC